MEYLHSKTEMVPIFLCDPISPGALKQVYFLKLYFQASFPIFAILGYLKYSPSIKIIMTMGLSTSGLGILIFSYLYHKLKQMTLLNVYYEPVKRKIITNFL